MINLADENFEKEISTAEKPVLVEFWMFGCPPCFLLSPILEKLANDYEEKIILAKVNLDTSPITAQTYGINVAPTIILFKEGKPISGFIGVRSEAQIREWLSVTLKDNEKEKIEKIIKESEGYAIKQGFKLNPNREIVERIANGLLENEKKYGFRYCPCRRITGNLEEDKPKFCPCQWHRQEIEKDGHCLCGLFIKR